MMTTKPTVPTKAVQEKMHHNLVSTFGMNKGEAERLVEEVIRGGGSPDDIVVAAPHMAKLRDFEQSNKGYEDYVLFVDELFSDDLQAEAAQFVHFVHLRYEGFKDYPVKFDQQWVKEGEFNNLLNEIYAPRNVDLLMSVCPDLEERLVVQKDKHQQKIYIHAKRRDPELALRWLVSHKKRTLPVHHKHLIDDMQVLIKMKRSIDERTPISRFIAKKNDETVNVLDALAMRGVLTPMGVYPAKAMLEKTVECIHQMVADRQIASLVKPAPAATTRENLLSRLTGFKGKLIASLAASAMIFSTANLQNDVNLDKILELSAQQQKVATAVQLSVETDKTATITSDTIVEQWCAQYIKKSEAQAEQCREVEQKPPAKPSSAVKRKQ